MVTPVPDDPVALATLEDFKRQYRQLSQDFDPEAISEVLVEATDHIETMIDRRLTPFTGHLYADELYGIKPDEYGATSIGVPLPFQGSLGISYANALGDNELVRHFWVDQFAPVHPELWTYNVQSVEILLTYGNTIGVDVNQQGALIGPETTDGHCFVPGTRVLTGGLEWVPIEGLLPGDNLVGFDETLDNGSRQYRPSVVEGTKRLVLPCYEVEFDDGSIVTCSGDHRWLVKLDTRFVWRRTDELRPIDGSFSHPNQRPSAVFKPLQVWDTDNSRDAGYLAAAFDGEGSLLTRDTRLSFCQRDNPMLERVIMALKERGFTFTDGVRNRPVEGFTRSDDIHDVILTGGRTEVMRFLGQIRPDRLLPKFDLDQMGQFQAPRGTGGGTVTPVRITPVGNQEVIALQTSGRTYLAEGFAAHNCWLRLGTFAPQGSRIRVVYDGGYTVAIPPALRRACCSQAASFLIVDAEPQMRAGMNLDELEGSIIKMLAPWARG